MIRRGPASGRFLPTPCADAVPLLVRQIKCARVSKGNRTRAQRQRERVLAKAAEMRRELGL